MAQAGNGGGGISLRTLIIASVASAAAAIITSRLWKHGTVLSAAMTPVIVAIVSEVLHRPAERVTQIRSTRRTQPLPEAGGPAPPPGPSPGPAPPEPAGGRGVPGAIGRRPSLKIAVATGVVAFAIAAAALTLPELIFGGAVANNRKTTIFGGHKRGAKKEQAPQQEQQPGVQTTPETTPETTPKEQKTTPEEKPPTTETQPPPTTPTVPEVPPQ
jgi:hypothetical protein